MRRHVLDPTTNTALQGGGGRERRAWLDVARGAAVVAMVVYHTAWDLSALRLVDVAVVGQPGWNLFARLIASTFLVLSGVGLALAHRDGVRLRAFLRRLAVLLVAAALVSAGTALAFPDAWVFFGILHNLAASSVVALPFVRLGIVGSALAAGVFAAAPLLIASPVLDPVPWLVLGLGTHPPLTNDWVPVFPWTGAMLAGVAIGLALPAAGARGGGPSPLRLLGALGRRSLLIYLVHQPVIYGACLLWLQAAGPNPAAEAAPFRAGCERSCRDAGESAAQCSRACACTLDGLKREGLWAGVLHDRVTAEDRTRVSALARRCLRAEPGDGALP